MVATAPSFATATINGYTVKTTPTTSPLAVASDSIVSPNISSNVDSIENKKIIMGIDIKNAFQNVTADLTLQVSHNGTDWADYAEVSSDTTPDVTGVKIYVVDLTNLYAPYFRLVFNSHAHNVGTSGTLQMFFAFN